MTGISISSQDILIPVDGSLYQFPSAFVFCILSISVCNPNPCKNDGICKAQLSSQGMRYVCKCPSPYAGRDCQYSRCSLKITYTLTLLWHDTNNALISYVVMEILKEILNKIR